MDETLWSEQDLQNIALYGQHTLAHDTITQDYLTPQQVAEILHVTDSTVYNWIKRGWLSADQVFGPKSTVGRYHISPLILEEMDKKKEQLIEESKRYWMRIYVKKWR